MALDNFIDKTDFDNSIYQVFTGSDTNAITRLNNVITEYQEVYLKHILGEKEYYDLYDNYATPTEKWTKFVDGDEYVIDGYTYHYGGIKPVLVRLCYYDWHRFVITMLGADGEFYAQYKDLIKVFPTNKAVNAFNKGVDLIYNNESYSPTVYHFLTEHPDYDFDDLIYTPFEFINRDNF